LDQDGRNDQLRHTHRSPLGSGCERCPATGVNDVLNSDTAGGTTSDLLNCANTCRELWRTRARAVTSVNDLRHAVTPPPARDVVGKTRRRLVVELISELDGVDGSIKLPIRSWSPTAAPS
ncbi:MAG: hypothetical protein QOE58_2033, partial [Actinomycetota bacterium]|nr:hypothetical protein [Actinomycetota bacterium]